MCFAFWKCVQFSRALQNVYFSTFSPQTRNFSRAKLFHQRENTCNTLIRLHSSLLQFLSLLFIYFLCSSTRQNIWFFFKFYLNVLHMLVLIHFDRVRVNPTIRTAMQCCVLYVLRVSLQGSQLSLVKASMETNWQKKLFSEPVCMCFRRVSLQGSQQTGTAKLVGWRINALSGGNIWSFDICPV